MERPEGLGFDLLWEMNKSSMLPGFQCYADWDQSKVNTTYGLKFYFSNYEIYSSKIH